MSRHDLTIRDKGHWASPRTVWVVVDNESWFLPHAHRLVRSIVERGDRATLIRSYGELHSGTVAFFLGCTALAPPAVLDRNSYNIVVHASDLPQGRGFAPITWQILEGRNTIPFTLFEAAPQADAGPVYARSNLELEGHELCDEVRQKQGGKVVEMCLEFLAQSDPPFAREQEGEATHYRRRTPADSRLDVERNIVEQFDLLRTVDNERYPAFFELRGHRYVLKIYKDD